MNLTCLQWACRYLQDRFIVDIYRIFSVVIHACRQLRTFCTSFQPTISFVLLYCGPWAVVSSQILCPHLRKPQDRYGTIVRYYWQTCRTTSLFPHYLRGCFAKHLLLGWERVDCCEELTGQTIEEEKVKCETLNCLWTCLYIYIYIYIFS